ncbi:uncharacterized protein LOC114540663, partial [Dendronephthya gigantea]|uniref:uncharacterized protein LOC114540663 n=1 Tax=Dendronephthya gigantea TaxID=151771 RepID=UPI00106BFEE5
FLPGQTSHALEDIKEEDSCSTLHPSTSPHQSITPTDPSTSQEQSMESLSETTESVLLTEETHGGTTDETCPVKETLQEEDNLVMESNNDSSENEGKTEDIDLGNEDRLRRLEEGENCLKNVSSKHEKDLEILEDRTSNEMTAKSCSKIGYERATLSSVEMSSQQTTDNSVETDVTSSDAICSDDVILSSSQSPGLAKEDLDFKSETDPALQMYSTPKLRPYKDAEVEQGLETDKEGYGEGISRDSGIHESKDDVDEVDSDGHKWIDPHNSESLEDSVFPRRSEHYADMPKYLCVRIKRSCWREHRPVCCRFAHEAIQRATTKREFWFSIPCERDLNLWIISSPAARKKRYVD